MPTSYFNLPSTHGVCRSRYCHRLVVPTRQLCWVSGPVRQKHDPAHQIWFLASKEGDVLIYTRVAVAVLLCIAIEMRVMCLKIYVVVKLASAHRISDILEPSSIFLLLVHFCTCDGLCFGGTRLAPS